MGRASTTGAKPSFKMMHMTFYWGTQATILFDVWKTSTWGDYTLSLLALFVVAVFYEYLASIRASRPAAAAASSEHKSHHLDAESLLLLGATKFYLLPSRKLLDSALFGVSVGIAYLLMLAVMSFNAGVFIAVVLGFSVGYFFFRSESVSTLALVSEADPSCACS